MGKLINTNEVIKKNYKKYLTQDMGNNDVLDIKNLYRMIIVGPSFSGKTNLFFNILYNTPDVFSHVHIIARNTDQEIYNLLVDKLKDKISVYGEDNIPTVDTIESDGKTPQLVIIDDFSNDKKLQTKVFRHFYTRGRHKLLSTIFIAHSYFDTNKTIRLNAEYVCILKVNSMRDLNTVVKDFPIKGITKEQMIKLYEIATKEKGDFIFIDAIKQQVRFNFDRVITDFDKVIREEWIDPNAVKDDSDSSCSSSDSEN